MDTYICPVCQQKESEVAGGDADSSSMPLQERHWLELRRIVTSLQVNTNSGQLFSEWLSIWKTEKPGKVREFESVKAREMEI